MLNSVLGQGLTKESEKIVFEESGGFVIGEAEDFYKQSKTDKRKWYITTELSTPDVQPDRDGNHAVDASSKSYIEVLPDTRVTHDDELIHGENFTNKAGEMAIVHYKVKFNTPGRYYVWVRAYSTGSEDNGLHVGINDTWPQSGQRMQWCDGKNSWTWASKQRTKEEHCGVPYEIYLDIDKPGIHDVQFSMREDGFEFDQFILTKDKDFKPQALNELPETSIKGQSASNVKKEQEPAYISLLSLSSPENKTIYAADFTYKENTFYKERLTDWLAIHPDKAKEAIATVSFYFADGNYDLIFVGVGENDGQSTYTVSINDKILGSYSPPLSNEMFEQGEKYNYVLENITLKRGDKITVHAKIGSADGKEWARARWAGIVFTLPRQGKVLQSNLLNSNQEKKEVIISPPIGRLAIVADGNSPDPDDLGGTAVSLALLQASGLADRLVHYSHSCDLVRGDRISERAEKERHHLMQVACDVTARRWGGFDSLVFYDALWQQEETVQDLARAIDASSSEDPLWIVEAGEPDIIGFALDASDVNKHQFVKVITHHAANDDAGDFYSWQQILDFGVEEVRIPDQNIHLKVDLEYWDWAKNHPDPRIQWVWLMGKIAEVDDVVKFQKGKWDCSDAGMVLYWITGATEGGLELGTVNDVKKLLLDFINANPLNAH